jgi:hypothetical protein
MLTIYRRFGALLKTYTQLAEIILHTIRIEVRCRSIYYLDAAFRHVGSNLNGLHLFINVVILGKLPDRPRSWRAGSIHR